MTPESDHGSRDAARSPGPNPVVVALSVVRSLVRVRRPGPFDDERASHSLLESPLPRLETEGVEVLPELDRELSAYLEEMRHVDPDSLTPGEALAYWINVYNAGALSLAGQALRAGEESVLGVPGGFTRPVVSVAGESLSLDDIEHGKLRRLQDPRIHAALVCGSVSCPTLRGEPYEADRLDDQLDDQLRHFLGAGALVADEPRGVAHLSRVFLWFGADFVRPHRMPTFVPARRSKILSALVPWMDDDTARWVAGTAPAVEFQRYDWGLSCRVR